MTRDMAAKFNRAFNVEALVIPEPYIVPEVAVVPGIDGQKMSKSYDNTLEIMATDKQTKKRCSKIVTDSTPLEDPKNPTGCDVIALLKLFASEEELAEIKENYRAGGYGYGHAKGRLAELINEQFGGARERYAELEQRGDDVRDMLREGGRKAREVAEETMQRVRDACGIITNR
ncbi:MAG: tryptophan--tRNA ligase, partial [Phycisphaerae bacterium]|nr:tryptophan--tRNA ligase [Phycisphaerae bacterium]